jgi:peptide/nickel transport system substrate-binding protein
MTKLWTPEIDRRRFLQGAAAAGAFAGAPLVGGARVARAAPGGRLRAGIGDAAISDTLDVSGAAGSAMTVLAQRLIRGFLVVLDASSVAQPGLAESWEPSADASTWRFKLRPGQQFGNGKEITAEDVIFSINLHRGEDSISPAKPLMAQITDLKADGDTVVISLSGGNADFPYYMTDYHLGIVPAQDQRAQSDVSSGAYTVVEFNPGVTLLVKKATSYWDQSAAKFDEVEVLGINDLTARTSALLSGGVDVINRVDVKTATMLGSTAGLKIVQAASGHHITFAMDTMAAPFDNNDLRLALKYACDREQMVKTVLNGFGRPGNDQPLSSVYRYFAADIPQRTYDPDKAKFHFQKSGFSGSGIPFSISEACEHGIEFGTLYQQQAAKAGIPIELIREPVDGYWDKVWLAKPFVEGTWFGRPTADQILTLAYSADAPWNETRWQNEAFMKLLVGARAELDDARRAEMYREAQLLIRDEGGALVPVFVDYLIAMKDTLTNGDTPVSGAEDLDGWRFAERWWFA